MSEDERSALVARCGAVVSCTGRALSPFNSCLLLTQLPTVSMVGGFWQWKDAGRKVRKGESGLSLWIPTAGKTSEPSRAEAIEAGASEGKKTRATFICGTVFGITQTEPIDQTTADAIGDE